MYCFVYNYPNALALYETSFDDINDKTSTETVSDYYNYCQEVCIEAVERYCQTVGQIGGQGEIDETKIGENINNFQYISSKN